MVAAAQLCCCLQRMVSFLEQHAKQAEPLADVAMSLFGRLPPSLHLQLLRCRRCDGAEGAAAGASDACWGAVVTRGAPPTGALFCPSCHTSINPVKGAAAALLHRACAAPAAAGAAAPLPGRLLAAGDGARCVVALPTVARMLALTRHIS